MVFAWRDARRQLGQTERFAWQALNHLQLVVQGPGPREPGHDRPEGILLWDEGQLLVVYDSPSDSHHAEVLPLSRLAKASRRR